MAEFLNREKSLDEIIKKLNFEIKLIIGLL